MALYLLGPVIAAASLMRPLPIPQAVPGPGLGRATPILGELIALRSIEPLPAPARILEVEHGEPVDAHQRPVRAAG